MSLSKTITLSKKRIEEVDLSSLFPYLAWNGQFLQYFKAGPGQEPYKLLAYISKHTSGVVSDVGTQHGSSALALSLNQEVQVETFDKFKLIPDSNTGIVTINDRSNIKYRILSGQSVLPRIAQSSVVYLDINTTDGQEEIKFITKLQELGFKGLLIIDDIHLNDAMKNVWTSVPNKLKKIDVTELGHWSGTGIIIYDTNFLDVSIA